MKRRRPHERSRCRREDNIKIDLNKNRVKEFTWPRTECSGGVCEHGNEALDPIKGGEFLDYLSDCKPIKKRIGSKGLETE
jgi:hypothetical protein